MLHYTTQSKRSGFVYALWAFLGMFTATLLVFIFLLTVSKAVFLETFLGMIPQQRLQGVNILVFGIDETKIVQRADTIMLVHLDEESKRIGVLSIPRDSRAYIPGVGISKVNHAYAHGGVRLLKDTVSRFLAVPIDHYVRVSLSGVETIVDELGGIPIKVDKPLVYEDRAANLHIDIPSGDQVLKGEDVIGYLRFRHDVKGDIGRIQRQQRFLKALTKQLLSSGDVFKSPLMLRRVSKSLETDVSLTEMMGMASLFSKALKQGNLNVGSVPGAVTLIGGISYWRPDFSSLERTVNDVLFGFGNVSNAVAAERAAKASIILDPELKPKLEPDPAPVVIVEKKAVLITKFPELESIAKPIVIATKTQLSKGGLLAALDSIPQKKELSEASPKLSVQDEVVVKIIASSSTIPIPKKVTVKAIVPTLNSSEIISKKAVVEPVVAKAVSSDRRTVTTAEVHHIVEQVDPASPSFQSKVKSELKLEVLNGDGAKGLAQIGARFMKDHGYKVVRFDNSKKFTYDKTLIVDWKNNVENALVIAQFLGIDPKNIIVYDRPNKSLDMTIVIGHDWDQLMRPFQIVEESNPKNE
ncbi:LCP family protein [bacterium]|jgi:LCP family protein required for cell wall assembly|nr:LCP family protein [bacterium]